MHRLAICLAAMAGLLTCAAASSAAEPLVVGMVQGNPAQSVRDPTTGAYSGVSVDIANALGRSWGRPVAFRMMSPAAIVEALGRGEVEIGFVAPNADRMGPVIYSQTYMLVQQTAIVRSDSSIVSAAQLDRDDQRIGANRGDSVAAYFARNLHHAVVVESADMTLQEPFALLRDGSLSAFAANRQRLGVAIRDRPEFRLLQDNIYAVPQAIAAPRTRPELRDALDATLDDMRRSGALARAFEDSKVDGISLAPAQPRQ